MAKQEMYMVELRAEQVDSIVEAEIIDRLDYLYQAMAKLQNGENISVFFTNDPASEKIRIADEIHAHETVLEWYESPEPGMDQFEIEFTPDPNFFSKSDKINFNLDDYLKDNDDEQDAGR